MKTLEKIIKRFNLITLLVFTKVSPSTSFSVCVSVCVCLYACDLDLNFRIGICKPPLPLRLFTFNYPCRDTSLAHV